MLLQMIKMGSDVETVLRESVLQMEHVGEKKLCMILFFSSPVFFFKLGTILDSNVQRIYIRSHSFSLTYYIVIFFS